MLSIVHASRLCAHLSPSCPAALPSRALLPRPSLASPGTAMLSRCSARLRRAAIAIHGGATMPCAASVAIFHWSLSAVRSELSGSVLPYAPVNQSQPIPVTSHVATQSVPHVRHISAMLAGSRQHGQPGQPWHFYKRAPIFFENQPTVLYSSKVFRNKPSSFLF